MPTPAYLSIKGKTQGDISSGCSSNGSIGNIWQEGHEERFSLNYHKMEWRHKAAGTSGEDDWKTVAG